MPAKAGTSFFSSKNMLTIADCHADVTLNLIQGSIGFSLPHFVRVLSLRNASSPQRNTRGALLGAVTARYVCSAVTAQPS